MGGVATVVAAASGIVVTARIVKTLGPATWGQWVIGAQVLTYLTLVDFGIVALLPREVAALRGRFGTTGGPAVRALLASAIRAGLGQALLVAVVAVPAALWVPQVDAALRPVLVCCVAVFALCFPLRAFAAHLHGIQDAVAIGSITVVANVAGAA